MFKQRLPVRGRKFTSNASAFEHIKREHVGKLSEESYHYLCSLGIPAERNMQFCKIEGIQLENQIANRRETVESGSKTLRTAWEWIL